MLVRESFVFMVAAIFFVLATDYPFDPREQGGISDGWGGTVKHFPYHALIGCVYPNETTFWFCQGAIINRRFVITTAVCVTDFVSQCIHFKIRVGVFFLIAEDPYTFFTSRNLPNNTGWMNLAVGVDYIANKTIPPPGFGLALLETNTQITYYDAVQPVILPNDTPRHGTELLATGFGFYHKNDRSYELQYITLSMLHNSLCTLLSSEYGKTDCALAMDHYSGELRGKLCREFGSPIVLKQDNRTLVGLYYRSLFCDCSKGPEFFIDIRPYIPWIRMIAGLDTLD